MPLNFKMLKPAACFATNSNAPMIGTPIAEIPRMMTRAATMIDYRLNFSMYQLAP